MDKCPCGGKLKYHDGALGYEAYVCVECEESWDATNEEDHKKQVQEYLQRKAVEAVRLKKAINKMANIYVEKRSDVSEICEAVLSGKEPKAEDAEHRFVNYKYAGKNFQYDTLTTLVEVEEEDGWKTVDGIEYTD